MASPAADRSGAPGTTGKRRPRWRPLRRLFRGRLRTLLSLAVLLFVVAFVLLLYLYVSVTARFDGRLWQIPARVYSDVLLLAPGQQLGPTDLADRLERSGYAGSPAQPRRAGQFRREGPTIDVFLRPFRTPVLHQDARRVRIAFAGDRVASIVDARGRRAPRVAVEPEVLATLYGPRQEERRIVQLAEIPKPFLDAVLAAEDARFFAHHGIDLRGALRAAWVNLREGRIVQGGSTITQQTVKNLYLDPSRTWWRKLREAGMAALLDARYSKERILEVYLNEVYLGQNGPVAICGVEAASRYYFGLSLGQLSLGESALLAGLIRSPGTYNPFVHPKRAVERRDLVLEAMRRLEMVDEAQVRGARAEPLRLASGGRGFTRAPWVVDFVRAQLAEAASSAEAEGFSIHTSVDTQIQAVAERVLAEGLERLERDIPALRRRARQRHPLEGAILVLRPSSGAILAMVGGRDYARSQFNRATQAHRQPGSCFKPFVYAAGLERARRDPDSGLTAATLLDDSPLELVAGGKLWRPENYDRSFRGPVTARQALEESLNIPTVRAAQLVGLKTVADTARRCGIESPIAEVPSMALGTPEVTPLELAAAYGAFTHRGTRVTPWIVRAVTDPEEQTHDNPQPERQSALSEQTAFLIRDLLAGVLQRGTAASASARGFYTPAAGKTGTTDDTKDAWFVGFTRDTLALVWVGYDDNTKTGLTGASGALPIWVELMRAIPGGEEPLDVEPPPGIVVREVDLETGELAVPGCPEVIREYFLEGTAPEQDCSLHAGRFRRWLRNILGRETGRVPGV